MKNLQTGDVIMFILSGIPACMARGSLYSHWDHIAIVIRRKGYSREIKKGQVLPEEQKKSSRPCKPTYCNCQSKSKEEHVELLEATASGIHVYSLEERFARARSHYKVIAVRKLRGFKHTEESQARLEKLICKVRGRGYQFMNKRVFMMGYHGGVPNDEKVAKVAALRKKLSEHQRKMTQLGLNQKVSMSTARLSSFGGQSDVFVPERVMCSELSSAALIHLHIIEPGIFEVDDIGPNTYSTIDSHDMLNQIVRKGVTYDPEFIFHYPGGPYNRALDALHQVMVENKTLAVRDHMGVVQRTSELVRKVSRLSFAPQIEPEVKEEKEPKHFTSMQAMKILANKPKKKRSRLGSVTRIITKISNRIVNGFTVADDWDVVVSSIADSEETRRNISQPVSKYHEDSSKEEESGSEEPSSNSTVHDDNSIFSASKNLEGTVIYNTSK
jgi:hypothetical protein